ncbi:SIR2 family protein [Photorhabdus sp. APURE]|uniref:SIR2 family protein n=1 Tax=Photorhabdus aballayi TaxID=2991723 RepID=UPI00223DA40F|nr:SIR2 family protein [Photorhabdus aballayi]MCW7548672.1 SIR2 family protein [Photorhabdus aballayi]
MTAFRPWLHDQSAANVPLDQIFNLLHLEYGKDEVNALVTKRLNAPQANEDIGYEHALIKRISSNKSGVPQIVTTNFDRLFEVGQKGVKLTRHVPPAFPDLNFGSKIEGITYLHGRLVEAASENHPYVLSSADFGRAYLSEGWATNFIKLLLDHYIVVLVGYQAEDPPVKYLLQGLNHDGQYDRSRLYAFDRGLPEEIEAKWRDRGVTAIAYSDHPVFWKSMEAWAERADDPRRWRASIISKSQQDPKILTPHERGQVAHVLRTAQGARLFAEAEPRPHPEWICVMDANIRSAKKKKRYSEFDEADAETFDPQDAYGLDDDLKDISDDERKKGIRNDNLIIWRDEDNNPHDFHRLAGPFETIPKRLAHLITWLGKSIDSPVIAWWAIRQNRLHPHLLKQFEWQTGYLGSVHKGVRHIWNLIIEHHQDPRNYHYDNGWYELKARIDAEGWTASVLREFRRVMTPRLEIKPPYGLGHVRPPKSPWEEIHLSELGQYEVVFTERHNEDIDVPDDVLLQVFDILEKQLTIASGLLEDIEEFYFPTPSCYPDREVEGEEFFNKSAEIFIWFIRLYDRVAAKWPELANAHATIWPATEQYYFRKLKLYAFSKTNVFGADHVAKEVLSLEHKDFWDTNVTRELLFLLADRWKEFSHENQDQIIERILTGPNQFPYWSDEEFLEEREVLAAKYARYLELQGCELAEIYSDRLAVMIKRISAWNDGWATSVVISWGSRTGWVGTDEKPDVVLDLPLNEIIPKAREELKQENDDFTRKRPFTGLVKENPWKALSALTIAGKTDDYPEEFWSSMISELPADIKPRLMWVFLNRVARLPNTVIVELRHTLSRWLEQNLIATLKFDADLGWTVYDRIVEGILSGEANATKSGLGEIHRGGEVINQSRRTFSHAINGPVGKCTQALFQAIPGAEQQAGSLIPDYIKSRIEHLFTAPGEGADHAVAITASKLNWLMFVDPSWTEEHLIPMLAFEHLSSEPAWNGFLHDGHVPSPPLARLIKPLLLKLIPWLERCSWEGDYSVVAAQWLGFLRVFHPDEPGGLSRREIRSILRVMTDETRNRFLFWLGLVGQKNENGWTKHVIPLISEDWPKEHRYRTTASVKAWIGLLDDTGDSFPSVYEAVKMFLVPVETDNRPFYRFSQEFGNKVPITAYFPETTLDLMNRITPLSLTRPPYELQKVLALIEEVEPSLVTDPRYLRLIELVEKS